MATNKNLSKGTDAAAWARSKEREALIEDAEFLADNGVTHADAVKRLGASSWEAFRKRVGKEGRQDVADRLLKNSFRHYNDDQLRTLGLSCI